VAPDKASGNALLDQLMGAEVHYVSSREARVPAMAMLADGLRAAGRKPYIVPLGASTPLGALGYVRAVGELLEQGVRPDVIVHACSSGGTTAGLAAGCTLHGLSTRIIGVSADDPAVEVLRIVRETIAGVGALLEEDGADLARRALVEIDDTQVGEGYGIPTERSREAQRLAATKEAIFVDHTYTAKALGALIAWVREGRFLPSETVLFWHTGGQVGIFA
jgi:1-aminocyclopropane-1-carboxylate deaminase/D-cysteine desulfhydrase-like pyridoxal-dependent ACC family enzyme